MAGRHLVLAGRPVRAARRPVHRRAASAGVRRRDHGAVPVRDHAPQSGAGRAHRPEGSGRARRGRLPGRSAPRATAGAAPDRPRRRRNGASGPGARDDPVGGAAAVHRLPRPVRDHQHSPAGGDRRRGRARQAETVMLLGPALAVSGTLFAVGVLGVLLRRNAIVIFMCVELMLNAANLAFVAFAQQLGVAGRGRRRTGDHPRRIPAPPHGGLAEHQPAQGLMPLPPLPPLTLLWVVPALPLAGFVVNGALALAAPGAKRAVSLVGVGVLVLAFAAAAVAVLELAQLHPSAPVVVGYWDWLPVSDLQVAFALQLDQLSAVMILVVTGVGALIHVFSVGYMHDDPGYARYFAYLNLFVFFMLTLVLGASFPVMFVGWEGVGLCSYLLIGFWFNEQINADAGKKAFIVNRIGVYGFLIAMFLIFRATGSLDFGPVFGRAQAVFPPAGSTITAITLFLFLGCTGKSAQIPLYTWLPDAMQGPTPVSALIHAATMVTAGVYLVARCNVLFAMAPISSE